MFFTSGTTGESKAVLSPHRATTRLFAAHGPMAFGPGRVMPLVNMLANAVRRTADAGGVLGITEMFPDLDRLWFTEARGACYTAELRMIAVRAAGDGAR